MDVETAMTIESSEQTAQEALCALQIEVERLREELNARPTGDHACTACDGFGTVMNDGYYVPGEQFCEPPSEERCEACVGSGQREVQDLVRRLAQFGGDR